MQKLIGIILWDIILLRLTTGKLRKQKPIDTRIYVNYWVKTGCLSIVFFSKSFSFQLEEN